MSHQVKNWYSIGLEDPSGITWHYSNVKRSRSQCHV